MQEFNYGPFSIRPQGRSAKLFFGPLELAQRRVEPEATRDEFVAAIFPDIAHFIETMKSKYAPAKIGLIDSVTGEEVGAFYSDSMCDMTPGLIDDRHEYWIRSADGKFSRDVTLSEYAQIVAEHQAPQNSWIAGMLPDEVLTTEPAAWRAPTSWEIRHVVGEGSFTGISGAKAAALAGISPQNFRKYTARDGAKNQQSMSFAIWHLLMHRLGVQNLPEANHV